MLCKLDSIENCLLSGMLMMSTKGFSISMTTLLYLEMACDYGNCDKAVFNC